MNTLRYLLHHHPVRTLFFAVALAAVVFFSVRLVASTLYWADPAHRDQAIEGWMTPRYVAMSWNVPRDVIAQTLSLETGGGAGTLDQIAHRRNINVEDVIGSLADAIAAHRADQP